MDNAQKAIMIGVGLFIAIVIISAVLLITNMGSTTIKKSTSDIAVMTEDIQNQLIKDYDGKVLGSTETLDLIKKYYTGKDGVSIRLTNGLARAYVGYKYIRTISGEANIGEKKIIEITDPTWIVSYDNSSFIKTQLSDFTNNSNINYIAPGNKYKTSIIYNENFIGIIGIAILKAT